MHLSSRTSFCSLSQLEFFVWLLGLLGSVAVKIVVESVRSTRRGIVIDAGQVWVASLLEVEALEGGRFDHTHFVGTESLWINGSEKCVLGKGVDLWWEATSGCCGARLVDILTVKIEEFVYRLFEWSGWCHRGISNARTLRGSFSRFGR